MANCSDGMLMIVFVLWKTENLWLNTGGNMRTVGNAGKMYLENDRKKVED